MLKYATEKELPALVGRLAPKDGKPIRRKADWCYSRFFKHKATIPVIRVSRAKSSVQVTIGITPLHREVNQPPSGTTPCLIILYLLFYVNYAICA